jgi:hypothetical protein
MDRLPTIRVCNVCGSDSGSVTFYNGVTSRCAECHKAAVRKNRTDNIEYYRAYDAKRFKEQPQRRAATQAYAASEHGRKVLCRVKKKWATLNTVKRKAHIKLGNAVKSGVIEKPNACSLCGTEARRIHGHHHDYSKPLDVIWVCPPCHTGLHR